MKNRKSVVVAFLLIAALLLGVGYAALTDTLTIAGQANVGTGEAEKELNEDVYFKRATAKTTTGTSGLADTASVLTDNDRASFTVNSLALGGQIATFEFVVYNESNHEVKLSVPTISVRDLIADGVDSETDNDNVFTVTCWDHEVNLPAASGTTPGEATITVTVQLYEDGINPENAITGYFDITFTATAE